MFPFTDENINPEGGHVKAADVALYGLHTIIPLMNADLLKVRKELSLSLFYIECIK